MENHSNSHKFTQISLKFPKFLPQIIENHALWKQRVPEFFQNKCISAQILPKFRCKFHHGGGSAYDFILVNLKLVYAEVI